MASRNKVGMYSIDYTEVPQAFFTSNPMGIVETQFVTTDIDLMLARNLGN
jgi:hypothetical protein